MAEGVGLIERNASPRTWQMIGEGYYIWWKCLLNYKCEGLRSCLFSLHQDEWGWNLYYCLTNASTEEQEMLVRFSTPVALTPTSLILYASSHPPHIAYFSLIKKERHFKLGARDWVSMATTSQRCYFSAVCNFEIRCNHARLDATK